MWSLLGHAIVVLSKLSLLRLEGWDQEYVRKIVDFSATMDALSRQLDAAKELAESQSFPSGHGRLTRVVPQLFSTFSAKLKRVKAAHEAKYMGQKINANSTSDTLPTGTPTVPTDEEFAIPSASFFSDFLQDSFWEQFT